VPDAGKRCSPHEVARFDVVSLRAAAEVDDGLNAGNRLLQPFAGREIANDELDAVLWLMVAAAQDAQVAAGIAQSRHNEASEEAGAACNQ
jgi:hypothetical protein